MMDDRLLKLVENIPNTVGVYFIYDKLDRLIYIGKSKHLKKRLIQHFRSTEYRELRIQDDVVKIEFEILGDETLALLQESDLIKLHQPKYNRALRKTRFTYGLYSAIDEKGYLYLAVDKLDSTRNELMTFTSFREGKERLFAITERFKLCQKINNLYHSKGSCFQYQLKECMGACIGKEGKDSYNVRVNAFIQSTELPKGEVFYEVAGRTYNEKGIIYLKDGTYKGFGYCKKSSTSKNVFLKSIQFREDNRDSRRLIKRFLLQKCTP